MRQPDKLTAHPASRRKFLKLLGAGAVGIGAGACGALRSPTGDVASPTYDLPETLAPREKITVEAGQTKQIEVGEEGTQRLENKLIDIRADGANVEINASGSNWAIRNIAVVGTFTGGNMIHVANPKGGRGLIQDCWFGSGADDLGPAAIFVNLRHAGALDVRRVYADGWGEFLYASAPGNAEWKNDAPAGRGGVSRAESCYIRNTNQCLKLGTTGSYAKDCVVENGAQSCFWTHWQTIRWINCHATGRTGFRMGYCWKDDKVSSPAVQNTKAIIENCHTNCEQTFAGCVQDNHQGAPQPNPDMTPPEGVPLKPEEALGDRSAG